MSCTRSWHCLVVALVSILLADAVGAAVATYHIGNSLTNDMLNGKLTAMSASRGRTHNAGAHIRSSATLAFVIDNPDDVTGTMPAPYGNYVNALPNYQWDAVTFQPYRPSPGIPSTLDSDVQAISSFIDLTHTNPDNADTRFYVYAAWPSITYAGDDPLEYEAQWLRSTSGEGSQPTMQARQYFVNLHQALADAGLNVKMIPAGEVLYALDVKMRAGEIPDFTSVVQLYRDDYHMNDLGKHLAACTTYATLFAESPVGLPYSSATLPVDGDILALMQQTVWDVVRTSPYTGVPEPASLGVIALSALMLLRRPSRAA